MEGYFLLRKFSLSEERSFGLDTSSVTKEMVPLVLSPAKDFELRRIDDDPSTMSFSAEHDAEPLRTQ
jgi:KUP system potassium uptake protein